MTVHRTTATAVRALGADSWQIELEDRAPLYREVADLTLDTVGLTPPEATARLTQLLAHRWQPIEENA